MIKPTILAVALAAMAAVSAQSPAPSKEGPLKLSLVTVLVRDQDEALRFYTEVLGLEKRTDQRAHGMRWVTVAPAGQKHPEIVLLKAEGARERQIGRGTTWVFDTTDCRKMYEVLRARGVKFLSPPGETPWGVQAVFEDLYGNPFALIQPGSQRPY